MEDTTSPYVHSNIEGNTITLTFPEGFGNLPQDKVEVLTSLWVDLFDHLEDIKWSGNDELVNRAIDVINHIITVSTDLLAFRSILEARDGTEEIYREMQEKIFELRDHMNRVG